jgi:hypothetical protein
MDLSTNCLQPPSINSAGIWSIPGDLCLFSFSIAMSTAKLLCPGTNVSAVYISVCRTSLTQYIFNRYKKRLFHLAKILLESFNELPYLSLIILGLNWQSLVKKLMPLYKSLIVSTLLLIFQVQIFFIFPHKMSINFTFSFVYITYTSLVYIL